MMNELDALIDGLWLRLRNVLIALDRVDRLENASDFVGWVDAFQRDDARVQQTSRDWVLRALRVAADPLHYQLLDTLCHAGGMSIAHLMPAMNLARVELTERLKDLAQVGFVVQDLETDAVQATRAAEGMVALIESLQTGIATRAYTGLMKDNPPPPKRVLGNW